MVRAQPVYRIRAVDHLLGRRRRSQHVDVRRDLRGNRRIDPWRVAGRGGPRLLEVVTIVFFVAVTVVGMVIGAQDRDWMDTYATTLSSGVLAVMALGSLAFVPFTAQYAPESAPQQDWEKAAFRRTNQVLTLMWALVFALIAVLGYVAVKAPSSVDWTKAVIPIVVIVGAVGMTQIYPTRARENARPGAA
jgi:peptidoglycan/LPS O-acetylase OafA/YrhL